LMSGMFGIERGRDAAHARGQVARRREDIV
jgi:hypothetical protein